MSCKCSEQNQQGLQNLSLKIKYKYYLHVVRHIIWVSVPEYLLFNIWTGKFALLYISSQVAEVVAFSYFLSLRSHINHIKDVKDNVMWGSDNTAEPPEDATGSEI